MRTVKVSCPKAYASLPGLEKRRCSAHFILLVDSIDMYGIDGHGDFAE
jgi:hypothetical protein